MPKKKFRWLPIRQYNDLSLLTLRLLSGGLMLTHGLPKYYRLLEGNINFPDPLGIGEELTLLLTILSEVLAASMVVLGVLTRLAVVPLILTMLVAIFVVHIHDAFQQKELAIFYLVIYLLLALKGPGKISLDYLLFKKSK